MKKLIKIQNHHYIIVDGTEIKEGRFIYDSEAKYIRQLFHKHNETEFDLKITHSTKPLEPSLMSNDSTLRDFVFIKPLDKQDVEEVVYGYSAEKMAEEKFPLNYNTGEFNPNNVQKRKDYIEAFKAHQELVKDKLFTAQDIINIVEKSRETGLTAEYFITKWLSKTEWEIEIDENNKIKLL